MSIAFSADLPSPEVMAAAKKVVKTTVGLSYDAARRTGRYATDFGRDEYNKPPAIIGSTWERDAVLEAAIVIHDLLKAELKKQK